MALNVGDWLSATAPKASDACGLFVEGGRSVPLKSRAVKATVYVQGGGFADTTETLSYVSDEDCTATFKFPLPPKAAVYRFKATMGDREIVTEVKPKAEAEEEYRLATSQGHGAVLMKQEPAASMFTIQVGNLEAHSECVVEFSYLRLLDSFSNTVEYVHTATWTPPYIGSAGDKAVGMDKVIAETPKFAPAVSYSLSYELEVRSEAGAIRSVECVEEGVELIEQSPSRAALKVAQSVADASKDFTLLVELQPHAANSCLLLQQAPATGTTTKPKTVALATFVPRASAPAVAGEQPAAATAPLKREVWMVVDCSGSMGGSPIDQARDATLFFVKDLPSGAGVKFNVTCFGSSHVSLFKECREYNAASEAEAVSWIQQRVHANLGGTEILDCMKHIYATPITPGYDRSIIFLTDGGISGSEEAAVYNLVQKGCDACKPPAFGAVVSKMRTLFNADDAKPEGAKEGTPAAPAPSGRTCVLSLGIGHGVHRSLLDGMADRSEGVAAFVVDGESLAKKCGYLKKCALAQGMLLRPRLTTPGAMVRAAPHVMPSRIFMDEPLHVLLEVLPGAAPDATLELTAELPHKAGGTLTFVLPLNQKQAAESACGPVLLAPEGRTLAVLHAMAYVGSLLSGTSPLHVRPDGAPITPTPTSEVVKDAVVRLAVAEHLVTPHTSAVGVMLRRDPLDPSGVKPVDVPLQLPAGRTLWGTAAGTSGQEHLRYQSQPIRKMAKGFPGGRGGGNFGGAAFGGFNFGTFGAASPAPAPACGGFSFGAASPAPAPPSQRAINERGVNDMYCSRSAAPAARMVQQRCHITPASFECAEGGAASAPAPLCDDDPMSCDDEEGEAECAAEISVASPAGHKPTPAPTPAPQQAMSPSDALAYLNLTRTTQGYWAASQQLWAALGAPETGAVHTTRPAGLSDDAWATVVVLAFLRKRLGGLKEVWADMEGKAMTWLAGMWPAAAAGVKSVGATVLAVAKAL